MSDVDSRDGASGTCLSERAALEDKQNGSSWNEDSGQLEPKDVTVATDEEEVGTQSIPSYHPEIVLEAVTHAQEKQPTETDVGAKLVTPSNPKFCTAQSAEVKTSKDSDKGNVDLRDGASAGQFQKRAMKMIGKSQLKPQDPDLKPGDACAANKDEMHDNSYSLYMEKDFRYYFQYPYARLFVAYFVTLCNFLIYAEDPVAHSYKEADVSIIGNIFTFIFREYAPNAWSLVKVVTWIAGIVTGLLVGKFLMHQLFFNRILRLKMFTDDQGSWMTMFICTIIFVFIFSNIYDAFLTLGVSTQPYQISSRMTISYRTFSKVTATGTWCGDFFTAWLVTDMMLQEKLYPLWARKSRNWWNTRYNRIFTFWIAVILSFFTVVCTITVDVISWDRINGDVLHMNELSRAFLASFILILDVTIVMQDWDFPHFVGAIDVKLPGINVTQVHFKIPQLLTSVRISGKWFNYGILFIVILLDLNMWRTQSFYAPYNYGQYIDPEGNIYTVRDEYSLKNFNESLLSFAYRSSTVDPITNKTYTELDIVMNARYYNFSLGLKLLAFLPCLGTFITFSIFVWVYGRLPKPTKDDPYAGRLKKRRKYHYLRMGWRMLRKHLHFVVMQIDSKATSVNVSECEKEGQENEENEEEEQIMVTKLVLGLWKSSPPKKALWGNKDSSMENRSKIAEHEKAISCSRRSTSV